MFITITIRISDKDYNIKIDKRQKIFSAFEILQRSGKAFFEILPMFVKSYSMGKIISTYNTFYESEIYSGDILEAITN